MKRQLIRFSFTLVCMVTLLGVFAAPTLQAQDEVVLSFVGTDQPDVLAPLIAAFEAENPNIRVEYQAIPFNDLNDVIQNRIGSGDSTPDVYYADQPRMSALVSRGLLEDITDDVGDISDVFWPSAIEASTVDGRLYSLPLTTSTQILYYNEELLEAAGIEFPSMDPEARLTWEELVESATAAQEAGAEWGITFDQVSRYYQIQPLPESLGGGSGVSPDNELEPAFTNDGWIEAMTFYGNLFESGLSARGVTPEQTIDLFSNGQSAFFVGGPWWLPAFDAAPVEFGVAPHPFFAEGEPVTPTGAWSWGVNPNTEHREEAIAFISFATINETGALAFAEVFPLPPTNIAVFNSYYAQNQVVPGVEELILYELENTSVVRAQTRGYIQFEEIIGQAMEDIRNGADVESTLESASQQLERVWSRME